MTRYALLLLLAGCGGSEIAIDSGTKDAGIVDSGGDTGASDAGVMDMGTKDSPMDSASKCPAIGEICATGPTTGYCTSDHEYIQCDGTPGKWIGGNCKSDNAFCKSGNCIAPQCP